MDDTTTGGSTLIMAMPVVANAQEDSAAKIVAKEMNYDFGTFKESDGDVSHIFVVTNEGKSACNHPCHLLMRLHHSYIYQRSLSPLARVARSRWSIIPQDVYTHLPRQSLYIAMGRRAIGTDHKGRSGTITPFWVPAEIDTHIYKVMVWHNK